MKRSLHLGMHGKIELHTYLKEQTKHLYISRHKTFLRFYFLNGLVSYNFFSGTLRHFTKVYFFCSATILFYKGPGIDVTLKTKNPRRRFVGERRSRGFESSGGTRKCSLGFCQE